MTHTYLLKTFAVLILVSFLGCNSHNSRSLTDPIQFQTKSEFAIDNDSKLLSSAIASIEQHPMHGPDYSWLIISFYPFTLSDDEIKGASNDDWDLIKKRMYKEDYNSHAKVILTTDKDNNVLQIDMSMPGSSCTIASTEDDIKRFLVNYNYLKERLTIKSNGSYTCGAPVNKTFTWEFDIDIPVFKKSK